MWLSMQEQTKAFRFDGNSYDATSITFAVHDTFWSRASQDSVIATITQNPADISASKQYLEKFKKGFDSVQVETER